MHHISCMLLLFVKCQISLIKFTIYEVVFSSSKAKFSCLVVKRDVLIINQEITMFAYDHCSLNTPITLILYDALVFYIIQESSWWLHGFCCGVTQRLFAKVVSRTFETNPLVMQCDDAFTRNGWKEPSECSQRSQICMRLLTSCTLPLRFCASRTEVTTTIAFHLPYYNATTIS